MVRPITTLGKYLMLMGRVFAAQNVSECTSNNIVMKWHS